MDNATINILYTPNNTTYQQAIVSMQSIIQNNKQNNLKFYLLIDKDFNTEYKKYFENYTKYYKNVLSVKFYNINTSKYQKISKKINYNNRIYILDAPELINEEKILFISECSIVNDNLKNLYQTDISEYFFAGCEYISPDIINNLYGIIGIKEILSSNTLLINLHNCRQKNFLYDLENLKFFNGTKKPLIWFLFGIIAKQYKLLNYRYDYTEEWWNSQLPDFSCSSETEEAYKSFLAHKKTPSILTYAGDSPMSINCKHSYIKLWWKYAKNTEIYDNIKEYKPMSLLKKTLFLIKNSQAYVNYSRILPYVRPYWFRALLAVLICIPIGSLDAIIALSLKPYMDLVMVEKTVQSPWYIPFGIVAFTSIQGGLNYLATYLNTWVGGKITNDLKIELFKKMLTFDTAYFDNKKSGDIVFRFNNDADTACSGLLDNLKTFVSRLFSSISLVGVLFYNSWQLALIAVLVLCCAFAPLTNIRRRIKNVMDQSVSASSEIITALNESFAGNKTIISYNLKTRQETTFKKILSNIFGLRIKMVQKTSWLSPMMHVIVSIGIGLAIGYGSHLIITKQITSGNFVSFITALIMLYTPIKNLGNNLNAVQFSFLAIERIFNILNSTPNIVDIENPLIIAKDFKSIDFKNVSFEYIKNKPVLKDINLHVNRGETIAFVGNSGGGKTTIVNLLPRFYDIKSGLIEINGIDIKDFSLESLRENIAVVFQDNFLFSGTIKENILLGNQKATDEQIKKALKMAYLDEFISSLKDGLNTQIGERGMLLSGGQKQRVAIARAFLKDAPIIILDEATSALDNKAEAIVQKAIDNLMKDKTVFVIAHRLSTIKNADKIAVINEGELVEIGNHNELMNIENGQYKSLYEMQFKKQEVNI